jgi:hypothetical protein
MIDGHTMLAAANTCRMAADGEWQTAGRLLNPDDWRTMRSSAAPSAASRPKAAGSAEDLAIDRSRPPRLQPFKTRILALRVNSLREMAKDDMMEMWP